MTIDVASLKVAELKEELSARGLPTTGLKKELALRLQEVVDAAFSAQPSGGGEQRQQQQQQGADGDDKRGGANVEQGDTAEREEDDRPSGGAQQAPQDIEIASIRGASPAPHPGASTTVKDTALAEAGVEQLEAADQEEAVSRNIEEEDLTDAKDDVVVPPALGTSDDERAPRADGEVNDPRPADEMMLEGQQTDDAQELSILHPNGLSLHTTPPLPLDSSQSSLSLPLTRAVEENQDLLAPSRCIYITGLVRPLTTQMLQSRVEEFGPLASLWLDGVKTHAFATFEAIETAQQARQTLDKTTFPPETGRAISVFPIPEDIAKRCIEMEDMAWEKDKTKMELRMAVEDGEARFSIHRLDALQPSAEGRARGGPLKSRLSEPRRDRSNGGKYSTHGHAGGRTAGPWAKEHFHARPDDETRSKRHRREDARDDDRDGKRARGATDDRLRLIEERIMAERQSRGGPPPPQTYHGHRRGGGGGGGGGGGNDWPSRRPPPLYQGFPPSRGYDDYPPHSSRGRDGDRDRARERYPPPRRDWGPPRDRDERDRRPAPPLRPSPPPPRY
ncbi:hypothetical protein FA10DRAFT_14634 [Acaromyces ingoldii]|uniref:SAP domain-containing protein n=1 Tax=Acaromyces ingoldii TaxID=215250 RepID=A0A316YU89_9BASI|nr:hypothetical protein FA10DRAFT_14634 [Acaromyces ingoldii]PWN93140.1 hypothetical protein FA10DRAFT_14634 [Acaromyces ingoldii]